MTDEIVHSQPGGARDELLSPERLRILAGVAEQFDDRSRARGRRYAYEGRVRELGRGLADIHARVHGTRSYHTAWTWTDAGWLPQCSCPVAPDCKHAFALACEVIADALAAGLPPASWMEELLPDDLVDALGLWDAEPSDPGDEELPEAHQHSALERLHSSPHWIERVHAVAELLIDAPRLSSAAFMPPLSDFAEVDDPDLRCFLVANELATHMGRRLPVVLAPFLDRDDLKQRQQSREQSVLIDQLAAWVGGNGTTTSRQLRLVLQLEEHPRRGAIVSLTVRQSGLRLNDQPRTGTQLRQLFSQVQREPELLPLDQRELLAVLLDPLISTSISDIGDSFTLSTSALLRLTMAVEGTTLAVWADDLPDDLAAAGGVTPGAVLRLAPGFVTVSPVLSSESGSPRVVLQRRLPDGTVLEEGQHLVLRGSPGLSREPTLVLARGVFQTTRGDPPATLSRLFETVGGFDPTPPTLRDLIEPLARSFPDFRASLSAHTRVHTVRPLVSLDLADDDWLRCRGFACNDPSWAPGQPLAPEAALFEWSPPGRWLLLDGTRSQRSGETDSVGTSEPGGETGPSPGTAMRTATAQVVEISPSEEGLPGEECLPVELVDGDWEQPTPTPADATVLFEEPQPVEVAPLGQWLLSLNKLASRPRRPRGGPAAADATGFRLRLSPRTIQAFMEAWDARPPGVSWFGNAAVKRLLLEPARRTPAVRVQASGVDWFSVSTEWQAEGAALTEKELARLRAARSDFVRLPSGWARKDEALAHDKTAATLAELGIEAGAGSDGEPQRVSLLQLVQATPEALSLLQGPQGDARALARVEQLRQKIASFKKLPRVAVPRSIKATLRPYQRDGLDFLAYTSGLGLGAILADDMGLGKTIQALAWLMRLIGKERQGGPCLVVCPASVLHNWEREAATFVPRLRVLALGAGAGRRQQLQLVPDHDLVLTNYALLRRDVEQLAAISWRALILDEAQNIKNPDAAVSRAARLLEAPHRLALTGTPLENRALDLWSIQAFLNPGYLGSRAAFTRRYDHQDAAPHARTLLAARLRPVMLRRLKSQVAPELPPRIEEQLDCALAPGQRKLYLAELAAGRSLLAELADDGGLKRHKISILALLTRLRQICCHPALVGGKETLTSGKFKAFFELIEPILGEGHKVLVFSQFVQCLKRVATAMDSRGIPHHMLTGSSRHRGRIVDDFEKDPEPSVFLISLKAGGTGLNLTAASYVVLFDPWWNPAVEAQAIDRSHRIGQDKTVIAYRLVASGTIEERIRELQQSKAALARDVLGEDGFAKTLTRNDLDYLLADL